MKRCIALVFACISVLCLIACSTDKEENSVTNDYPPMIMFNDTLYSTTDDYNPNKDELTVVGKVESFIDGKPTENNQANDDLVGCDIYTTPNAPNHVFVLYNGVYSAYKTKENPPDGTEKVTLYTVEENTIAIPDDWGKEVVVNPDDNFYLTPQTLFALFCEDAFSDLENELGWIVSICYYTEDEYQEMYLESPSKQYVFAKDDLGYYCVLLPTDIQTDDPVLNEFMENIRNNEIQDVVRDMISRNDLEAYKETESDKPRSPDAITKDNGTVETFKYDNLVLEVSNVKEIRKESSFDGMETWEYDVYVVYPGATLKVLEPDTFIDEESGLDHANWAIYLSDDSRIDIDKEMNSLELNEKIIGVYDPESSVYVLGFEMYDNNGG